jgi:hypothetical protein
MERVSREHISRGVKLTPLNAEVKNAGTYISAPPYIFMTWCLIKHRDNFAFILLTLT